MHTPCENTHVCNVHRRPHKSSHTWSLTQVKTRAETVYVKRDSRGHVGPGDHSTGHDEVCAQDFVAVLCACST